MHFVSLFLRLFQPQPQLQPQLRTTHRLSRSFKPQLGPASLYQDWILIEKMLVGPFISPSVFYIIFLSSPSSLLSLIFSHPPPHPPPSSFRLPKTTAIEMLALRNRGVPFHFRCHIVNIVRIYVIASFASLPRLHVFSLCMFLFCLSVASIARSRGVFRRVTGYW